MGAGVGEEFLPEGGQGEKGKEEGIGDPRLERAMYAGKKGTFKGGGKTQAPHRRNVSSVTQLPPDQTTKEGGGGL